ncbi:protein-glutamate O-methyltransferase CheR [Ralstonia pickettii]|uniref:CheR family methyltransferase n=1 Tax=Ralstonia pickettii TaxID=329 RepID=UPI002714FE91|nr:CheR family methyltransferase [Ralstonia pickettii]WKZ87313.1 protein-glutamate O-methyltransferase CheR [Ralstonia pickettii]
MHAIDPPADVADDNFALELELLLEAIFHKYHHDFRHYSRASLRRRLKQALHDLRVENLSLLQGTVLRDPSLFNALFKYLTVQVSEMFRDPSYYRALREEVVPVLRTYPSLKVWVPGCSTGEELWSLAILFAEEGLSDRTLFYATDINAEALAAARAGIYDVERLDSYSAQYLAAGGKHTLSHYFHVAYGAAKFDAALIGQSMFADHSLATDGVFSEVHLVSCRNVLIYFDRPLQDRAIGLFKDSLVWHGFLGLGSKESLQFNLHADAFETLNSKDRVYRKR